MTDAQIELILKSLKLDLGIISATAYDERLTEIIKSSFTMIEREGATLNVDNQEDAQLVIMYAEWTWRRRSTGEAMPRMLRWSLNNRILSEKAQ